MVDHESRSDAAPITALKKRVPDRSSTGDLVAARTLAGGCDGGWGAKIGGCGRAEKREDRVTASRKQGRALPLRGKRLFLLQSQTQTCKATTTHAHIRHTYTDTCLPSERFQVVLFLFTFHFLVWPLRAATRPPKNALNIVTE